MPWPNQTVRYEEDCGNDLPARVFPGKQEMNAAERYDRLVLPFVRPFTRPLVDSVDCADEGSVLDHGTGTGEVALAIHRRCPHARVTALDPSADMLEGLRAKAVGVQPWLTIQKGTMASAGFERAFDVCLSQLVLMFVPDPGEELRLLRRAARPGGSLGLVVLRKAESMVPFFAYWSAAQRIVPGAIEPAAYPHHQFSDPDALAALARDAGWLELRTRAVDASRR